MHVPKGLLPIRLSGTFQAIGLTGSAIAVAIVAWGFVSFRSAGNQSEDTPAPEFDWTSVRSAAFLVHNEGSDQLIIHTPGSDRSPEVLASFERRGDSAPRGQASPMVDKVAVVHPALHAGARLTVVDIDTDEEVTSPAVFDSNTTIAWARDGSSLVAASSTRSDDSGRLNATLHSVNAATGETRALATFESVFRVAPVGFSLDGQRLFVVVLDQAGSSLWSLSGNEATEIAPLSAGRTRDWALSPDGTMLGYIEVRSGSSAPTVGRVVFTATGAPVQASDSMAAQEGVAWQPGNTLPGFGGPGGTLRLEAAGLQDASYIVPESWSPDGTRLIARVVHPAPDGETSEVTWELFRSPGAVATTDADDTPARTKIFDQPGEVTFLGWVKSAPNEQ